MSKKKASKRKIASQHLEKSIRETEKFLNEKTQQLSKETDMVEGIMLGILTGMVINIIYGWWKESPNLIYYETAIIILFAMVLGHMSIRLFIKAQKSKKIVKSLEHAIVLLEVVKKGKVTKNGKTYVWSERK